MSEPFIGQIMSTGFAFAPHYWANCDGQLMQIQQNQALFALLGVMYGGNGTTNFNLPDLRGRAPIGALPSAEPGWQPVIYPQGAPVGTESVTLTSAQIPAHMHALTGTSAPGANSSPGTAERLATSNPAAYGPAQNLVGLAGGALPPAGANPHENMPPFDVISMCIALTGTWPSRN